MVTLVVMHQQLQELSVGHLTPISNSDVHNVQVYNMCVQVYNMCQFVHTFAMDYWM